MGRIGMDDDKEWHSSVQKKRVAVHPTYALDVICESAAKNLCSSHEKKKKKNPEQVL